MTTPAVGDLLRDGELAGSWTLDAGKSSVQLRTRHTWGLLQLVGAFTEFSGSGTIAKDGTVSGVFTVKAASVETRNPRRDKHLRSADFFHAEKHPQAVLTITSARPAGPADLECQGTFEAAGHARPVSFTAHIDEATAQAVVLTAELEVDRTEFDMTWSPMRIASMAAHGTVRARFVRA